MTLNTRADYLFGPFGGYEGALELWGLEDLQEMVQFYGYTAYLTPRQTVIEVPVTEGSPPITTIKDVITPVPNNSWEDYGWLPGTPIQILSRDYSQVVETELQQIPYTDRWCWGVSEAQRAWVASKPHGSRWWGRIQTANGFRVLQLLVNLKVPGVATPEPPATAPSNEVILQLGNYPKIRLHLGSTTLIKSAGEYVYWKPQGNETLSYEAVLTSPGYDLVGKTLTAADTLLVAAGLTRQPNGLIYTRTGTTELKVTLGVSNNIIVTSEEDAWVPLNLSAVTGTESWRLKQTVTGKAVFESRSRLSGLGWTPAAKASITALIS
jgi:hypothetical protein